MNINSLNLASTLSPPARLSADSVVATWMNWLSQRVSAPSPAATLMTGGRLSSSGLKGEESHARNPQTIFAAIGPSSPRLAKNHMRIAAREDDDFARLHCNRFLADDIGVAPALRDDMIGDQMAGAVQDLRQNRLRRRLFRNPGRSRHDVKKRRSGQSHSFQNVGQRVCGHFPLRRTPQHPKRTPNYAT